MITLILKYLNTDRPDLHFCFSNSNLQGTNPKDRVKINHDAFMEKVLHKAQHFHQPPIYLGLDSKLR